MKTIKDIAQDFNISAHAIRYYEKEGLIQIPRDGNGIRIFDEKTISTLRAITYYRNLDLSLKSIRNLMADFHNHEKSLEILEENLEELEHKIKELELTKTYVTEKIELHRMLLKLQKEGKTEEEQFQAYQDFVMK